MDKVASLLDFAICFDNIKAVKPDVQNDLSFFRRLAAVSSMTNQIERYAELRVPPSQSYHHNLTGMRSPSAVSIADAPLNTLSFFVAEHNPMTKALVRAVEDAMKKEPASVSVMAQLANSLCSAVANQKCVDSRSGCFPHPQTALTRPVNARNRVKDDRHSLRTLRAMTGAILVYDHTNTNGAFGSKSEIKVSLRLGLSWDVCIASMF